MPRSFHGAGIGRWLVALVAVLSIASVLFLWWDGWAAAMLRALRADPARLPRYGATLLESIAALIAAGVALMIALRAWGARVSRALALFLVAIAISLGGLGFSRFLGRIDARNVAAEGVLATIALAIAFGALVRFSALLQPSLGPAAGRTSWRTRLRRWSEHAPAVWLTAAVAAVLMTAESLMPRLQLRPSTTEIFFVVAAGVAFNNLALGHRDADAASKRAIWWVVAGALFALIGVVLRGALTLLGPELGNWAFLARFYANSLGLIALLLCLAMAIFHRGMLDPRLVVRRTALTAGVASVLVFGFAVVESAVSDVLVARFGGDGVAGWVAGAIIALGAAPLWRATRRFVARLLPPGEDGDLSVTGPPESTGVESVAAP